MILLYWISRGFTEGYRWADKIPSAKNYHIWRLVEVLAILIALNIHYGAEFIFGEMCVGAFLYERINMKISQNKWFKKEGEIFDIGYKIPRYKYQDFIILGAGLLSLGIGIF